RIADCGLRIADCGLRIAVAEEWHADNADLTDCHRSEVITGTLWVNTQYAIREELDTPYVVCYSTTLLYIVVQRVENTIYRFSLAKVG
ncbi:MAG: hypothetical protein ACPGWR_24780, partial [Ardenticatenaceae bacterium]